jgi:hypothetical protein
MKPPQSAVWMFQALGARVGDGWSTSMDSDASPEAWRRYTATGRHIRDPGRHGQPRAPGRNGQGTVFMCMCGGTVNDVNERALSAWRDRYLRLLST